MMVSVCTTRKIFIYTLCGVFACFVAWWVLMVFARSPNIAGIENNTIYFVQRILDGSGLYTDPESPPYAIAQYNPLYYYVVAGAARLTGTGPDDVLHLFLVNRAVSLILLLSVAVSVSRIGRKIFFLSPFHSKVLAAVVFIFMGITSFARADSLALAFYFPSLLLFLSGISGVTVQRQRMLWAGILAGLAFWSKQPALVLFLFSSGWLVLRKRSADFLPYLAGFGITVLGGLLVIYTSGGLGDFYKNVFKGIDNGYDLHGYFNVIIGMFLAKGGLAWFLLMAVVMIMLRKVNTERSNFLALLILLQFLFSMLSSMRNGASSNYFAEWWILVLLGTAVCRENFSRIAGSFDPRLIYWAGIIILLLRLSVIVYPVSALASGTQRAKGQSFFNKESALAAMIKTETDGRSHFVFNNLFSPDSYLNNLLFREAVIPQNDIVTFGTWHRNVFDYTAFKRQLENGAVKLIVMKKGELPAMHLDIPMMNYKAVDSTGEYIIYRHLQYADADEEKP